MAEVIGGVNAVASLLETSPQLVLRLVVLSKGQNQRVTQLLSSAKKLGLSVQHVDAKQIDKMAGQITHQGVLAEVKQLPALSERDLDDAIARTEQGGWLVLDGVTDPHNLGACMRSAAAFGVNGVIVPKDASASINATVMKSSAGTALNTPFYRVTNLARAVSALQKAGFWVYGADGGEGSQSLADTAFDSRWVLIMGSEGKGMRQKTRDYCDYVVSIPMAANVESLNVSVACGILLHAAFQSASS